jgi:hypothetical protein
VRRKPYTARGIKRVPCARCRKPSYATWQVCALGRRFLGLCKEHDVELNAMVLKWVRWPGAGEVMRTYRRKVTAE